MNRKIWFTLYYIFFHDRLIVDSVMQTLFPFRRWTFINIAELILLIFFFSQQSHLL